MAAILYPICLLNSPMTLQTIGEFAKEIKVEVLPRHATNLFANNIFHVCFSTQQDRLQFVNALSVKDPRTCILTLEPVFMVEFKLGSFDEEIDLIQELSRTFNISHTIIQSNAKSASCFYIHQTYHERMSKRPFITIGGRQVIFTIPQVPVTPNANPVPNIVSPSPLLNRSPQDPIPNIQNERDLLPKVVIPQESPVAKEDHSRIQFAYLLHTLSTKPPGLDAHLYSVIQPKSRASQVQYLPDYGSYLISSPVSLDEVFLGDSRIEFQGKTYRASSIRKISLFLMNGPFTVTSEAIEFFRTIFKHPVGPIVHGRRLEVNITHPEDFVLAATTGFVHKSHMIMHLLPLAKDFRITGAPKNEARLLSEIYRQQNVVAVSRLRDDVIQIIFEEISSFDFHHAGGSINLSSFNLVLIPINKEGSTPAKKEVDLSPAVRNNALRGEVIGGKFVMDDVFFLTRLDKLEEIYSIPEPEKHISTVWNHKAWLKHFNITMQAMETVQSHEESQQLKNRLLKLRVAVAIHNIVLMTHSTKGGFILGNSQLLPAGPTQFYEQKSSKILSKRPTYNTRIEVVNEDCLETAEQLAKDYPVAVMNLANAEYPGGHYVKGFLAQEESIIYRSNYISSLDTNWKKYQGPSKDYPWAASGGAFTKDVTVFRLGEEAGYCIKQTFFKCSIVAVAGISNPRLVEGRYSDADKRLVEQKIKNALLASIENGCTAIVLGALGCGVYRNPPAEVASCFKTVLKEYAKYFETVCISCD
eukprot:TRINITY_DN4999_c0_g1_i2.p1 TRINITY_DN4999_c0_g1~~TRINITY_DN4999_c0_g1_i2.p1  ORF type:complete len:755 (+),score=115.73 TRINITY_DN4999_c0_g1_i2:56-2320(+)